MLLQRGHESNLSGFFSVLGFVVAASLCSFSDFDVSSSIEGVFGF
jgi:hypothetical protein